ncbi:pentatricopeptide repeat-containing protein at4g26680 mitochondrial [Phtheirospermum japonicum]|uniref:Pentatricopeptide repeat-containing protein at4g26680 mitochondrial n=1 Tax=Phtheirospermum japonicum TaxID=374723 RepID=A0A830BNQ2_9LAMI|nr:pentatricopeptide repeat-containing protein at4g26680 mitochondrial [Phtheirospermum japonicum]
MYKQANPADEVLRRKGLRFNNEQTTIFSPTTAAGSMSRVSTQRRPRPEEFDCDVEVDGDPVRDSTQQTNGGTPSFASRRPRESTPRSGSRRRKSQEPSVVSAMQSYICANDTITHAMAECTTSLVDALELLDGGRVHDCLCSAGCKSKVSDARSNHETILPARGQDLDFINIVHSHLIHSEWDKLSKLAPGLTPFRIKHILLKTRKDHVISFEFFNWVDLKNSKSNTLDVISIILHILTKNRHFKSSESILRRVLETGSSDLDFPRRVFDALVYSYRMCESSSRVFDALFKTHASMNKFRNASDCFRWMSECGFYPTVESCNTYLSALCGLNRSDIMLVFYKEMRRCRISPNVYTVNMVIDAYCKLGKLETAIEVFKEMEGMGLACNVVSYNTLIAGYCSKRLLSGGLKIKNAMEKNGVRANDVTYNTLINAFCKEGELHESNKLFREMKSADVAPTTVTYNTLINAYSENGNSRMAIQMFDEMCVRGVKADILTYNAVIMGLCKEGKTKKAAYMVRELDKGKLVPNSSTFAALITGQCARNNAGRAFQIYESMVRSCCYPNETTFKMLISAFVMNEDYDGAVRVLKEMMRRAMAPDSNVLSSIFDGLSRDEKEDMVMDLRNEIESRRLLPEGFEKFAIMRK